jgi:hypothetical protein
MSGRTEGGAKGQETVRSLPSRCTPSPPRPVSGLAIVEELGSGREAMPLNSIDWHGDIPRPPALFPTAAFPKKVSGRLPLSPGHVNPPPEAPVPSHQTTVMIGVPVGRN